MDDREKKLNWLVTGVNPYADKKPEQELPPPNPVTVDLMQRIAIAKEFGLPTNFAARLVGSTPDEIREDARRMSITVDFKKEDE